MNAARTVNTKDLITDWEEIPGIDEVIERAKGCLTEGHGATVHDPASELLSSKVSN